MKTARVAGSMFMSDQSGVYYGVDDGNKREWFVRWENGSITNPDETAIDPGSELFAQLRELFDVADHKEQYRTGKFNRAAKEMAGGDHILEQILRISMEYHNSTEVISQDDGGVLFYCVGHNATHYFSLGRKDGKTYKLAIGESDEVDQYDTPLMSKRMSKLAQADGFGYIGHF